ncbi:MAG TPA: EVE domain-containing protein [Thermoanaerobaculia bacterium]|jgi:hypothetical protein|nr:EVE domain-containing protein [Thermoanaerobaculia bacterium]
MKFWIGVASRDHVQRGVTGGFAQLNHGKRAPLKKIAASDGLIYYSPRMSFPDGEPCQAFTAAGRVRTGGVYQADMGGGFKPYRIDIDFVPTHDAPIRPLLSELEFLPDKTHWGAAFRFGYREISEADFRRILAAMGAELPG